MLKDHPIQAVPGDLARRWISDEYFDLIIWYDRPDSIYGFQLCYDKQWQQRALTWIRGNGFSHATIDNGETMCTANSTPILCGNAPFPAEAVAAEFQARSKELPAVIRDLVLSAITDFGRQSA